LLLEVVDFAGVADDCCVLDGLFCVVAVLGDVVLEFVEATLVVCLAVDGVLAETAAVLAGAAELVVVALADPTPLAASLSSESY
jgi:hypothetical protein